MAYIGVSPSNGVRRVHTYTATASQTTFSGAGAEGTSLSYKDSNYVDVYQNGIKLGDADYTSTSGTSIVLAQGASVDDLVVVVVFDVFSVADTVSKADGGTFDSAVTIDADGATVLTVDRATSDGAIIDLQKGGTSVGKIGNAATDDFYIGASTASHSGLYFGTNIVYPMTANSLSDGATSLGHSSNRFNNLYLSGGAYIGGTGSSNYLEDYEEGTFTPTFGGTSGNPTVSYSVQLGTYIKVGNIVSVTASVIVSGTPSGGAGDLQVKGLPFTGKSGIQQAGSVAFTNNLGTASGTTQMGCNIEGGVSYLNINSHEYSGTSSMSRTEAPAIQNSAPRIVVSITYETS